MCTVNKSVVFLLAFVLIISSGFTCQKKYPEPAPEEQTEGAEDSTDSSSENSKSNSETTPPSDTASENPVEKTDK